MLGNYFLIAARNIFRQKVYSVISISGLALGMACSFFLLLRVHDEQSFDKFHKNAKNLYRLEQDQKTAQGNYHVTVSQFPAGPALKENIPEIKETSRWISLGRVLIRYRDHVQYEKSVNAVDPSFLSMFSFPLVYGNSESALNQPFSIILTETIAKKYFGSENPVGKTVTVNNREDFTVTGVMKDAPANSTLRPGILVPVSWLIKTDRVADNWNVNFLTTWVELHGDTQLDSLNKKITEKIVERTHREASSRSKAPAYMLMPLTDINLYGYSEYDQSKATINTMKIYLALAFLVLLLACINYSNLATARSAGRAKEIGLRKTVGASRIKLIIQFFSESLLLSFVSFGFALVPVILLLPLFNDLAGKQYTVESLFNTEFLIIMVIVAVITGIISGSYPSVFLSSFSPMKVFRGNLRSGSKGSFFRKTLVVFQFSFSVVLVIGAFVAYQQVQFMRTMQAGYEKDHLVFLPLRGETGKSYPVIKQELLKSPYVLSVSGIDSWPTDIGTNSSNANWDGKDPDMKPLISTASIDYGFAETLKIEMVEGRTFSKSYPTDSSNGFLINEELAKVMGAKPVAGKRFEFMGVDGRIVGVMKNFHYTSAHFKIEPLAFLFSDQPQFAVIRLKAGDISASVANLKSIWQKNAPLYPFECNFFDEDFAAMYKADEQMGDIFMYGAVITIGIACLGLFGFVSFMAEKRTKEIGIRKILGCSVPGITILLSKDFIMRVLIANVIAWPVAFAFLNQWLRNYAYRISIEWWVFAIATILSVAVAMISVSFQAVKAARGNPIDSLKYE